MILRLNGTLIWLLGVLLIPLVQKGATLALGLQNITIDDGDSRITYFPRDGWQTVNDLVDFGGSHVFTSEHRSYAEITMTFVSFYVMSALYPCLMTTVITLDGEAIDTINLTDPTATLNVTDDTPPIHGTTKTNIVSSYRVMSSQPERHIVRLSPGSTKYTVLDAFIFEVESDVQSESSLSSSFPTSSGAAATGDNAGSTNQTKLIAIVLGVCIPILVLVICVLVIWKIMLRRRKEPGKTIYFDPNAMGGRPATRQEIHPDDTSSVNGDGFSMGTLPNSTLETSHVVHTIGNDGQRKRLHSGSTARAKTPESNSPLTSARLNEHVLTGNVPPSTLSTSPDSTASLGSGYYSLSRSNSTSATAPSLRPLSPVRHPSQRGQMQPSRRVAETRVGEMVPTPKNYTSNFIGYEGRLSP